MTTVVPDGSTPPRWYRARNVPTQTKQHRDVLVALWGGFLLIAASPDHAERDVFRVVPVHQLTRPFETDGQVVVP